MRAGAQAGLRAYVPNVVYGDWAPSMAAKDGREPLKPLPMSTVLGLALVAVRDVRDEELLLNYRCGIAVLAACCDAVDWRLLHSFRVRPEHSTAARGRPEVDR